MRGNSELFAKSQDVLCIVSHDMQMENGFACATAREIFERKAPACLCMSLDVHTRIIQWFDIWQRTRSVAMTLTGKLRAEHETEQACLHERNPVSTRQCPQVLPLEQPYLEPETIVEVSSGDFLLIKAIQQDQTIILSGLLLRRNSGFGGKLPRKLNEVYFDHRKWVIGSGAHDQLVQDFSLEKVVKVRELIIRTNKRWEPRLSSRTTPGETREEKQQWVRQSGLLRVR